MSCEYRVSWRREGLQRVRKIYQTREGAERFVLLLEGRDPERPPYPDMPGSPAPEFAEIVEGPSIEEREVGPWRASPEPS